MPESPSTAPSPPAHGIAPPEIPGLHALLSVVVGVVVVAALYVGREVLVPITVAVLLSFVLAPVVDLLRRLWLGRVLSVLLAILLALGGILFLGGLIGTQIAGLVGEVPRYAATLDEKAASLRVVTVGRVTEMMEQLEQELRRPGGGGAGPARDAPRPDRPAAEPGGGPPRPLPVEIREPDPSPLDVAERVLSPVLEPLANAAVVLVVAVFVLLQRRDLRDRLIRLAGSTDIHRATSALDDAARRLSRFFLTQLAINTAYGAATGVALFAIGVPAPLLWGILAALMRFVPYIGTPIAAVPPVLLAAAADPGWSTALWTAAYFLVGEGAMGQVVEPVAFGQSTGLSPASVVVAAIFWSWLWGPVGLLLATPLTLCLVVLGRHVERLEFLDVLLGDRPALAPAESFYQRMLAGDPDEALDQAELLLKERPLSSYYDEVALEGLRLAAADANRGVLSPDGLERVKEAVGSLVADLSGRDDAEPPSREGAAADATPSPAGEALPEASPPDAAPAPDALPPEWRSDRAILCIAGRGPLDEAASAMLAQLLGKHGLGATVVPHRAVARGRVDALDVSGVAMACISYLEISGSPAHLRHLLRRLRQRLPPGTPILVGLWPSEEAVPEDPRPQKAVGADGYVGSLREAVQACLDAARGKAAGTEAPTVAAERPGPGAAIAPGRTADTGPAGAEHAAGRSRS